MSLEEFLKTNPSKEEVVSMICKTTNSEHLHIEDLWCYKELCSKHQLSNNNFYEDINEVSNYEMYYVGVYNWKYKL